MSDAADDLYAALIPMERDGERADIHPNSVAIMEGLGFRVVIPEPEPPQGGAIDALRRPDPGVVQTPIRPDIRRGKRPTGDNGSGGSGGRGADHLE